MYMCKTQKKSTGKCSFSAWMFWAVRLSRQHRPQVYTGSTGFPGQEMAGESGTNPEQSLNGLYCRRLS